MGAKLTKTSARTNTKLLFNDAMVDLAISAAYHAGLKQRRVLSLRATVVEGLDTLIRCSRFQKSLLLQRLDNEALTGDIAVLLLFDPEERRLIHEVRALMQQQRFEKLSIRQVIILAILALTPPSTFQQIGVADVPPLMHYILLLAVQR